MKSLAPLLLAVAAALSAAAPARAQSVTAPVDGIVAVVDEDVILRSELDQALGNITRRFAQNPQQLPPRAVLERQVLDSLITQRLQVARAESAGIRIADAEIEQTIAGIAAQNNLTLPQLAAQLERDGLSMAGFRTSLREELMTQRLRQGIMRSRVQVSESEIDLQLAAQAEAGGREFRLSNIVVGLPNDATPAMLAEAQSKIEGVRALVERGEMDFAAAAIRYSNAPNALDGGNIGWRRATEIPPQFLQLLEGMQAGQMSQTIRGPSGLQIVRLDEVRAGGEIARQVEQQFKARGLLVRITELVSAEEAMAKVVAARARIEAGEEFATVARELSDDTMSRNQGGDMGWFAKDAWGSAIAQQLDQLADGQLSQPFRSDVGVHLLLREGVREQDVTEQVRREQAREAVSARKAEDEYERFLRQLRDEAYIDNRLAPATAAPAAPAATPAG
jgi:peptidyl-prolyl cis-trans isomerase SurA